jgi:anoctamin-10
MSTSIPQRATRTRSSQKLNAGPTAAAGTAPGPPIPNRDTSAHPSTALDVTQPTNPFQVDLVIPYSVAITKGQDRSAAQQEIRQGYEALLRALEGEGGLKVATRGGRGAKGDEEVWVFVAVGDEKVQELVEREK